MYIFPNKNASKVHLNNSIFYVNSFLFLKFWRSRIIEWKSEREATRNSQCWKNSISRKSTINLNVQLHLSYSTKFKYSVKNGNVMLAENCRQLSFVYHKAHIKLNIIKHYRKFNMQLQNRFSQSRWSDIIL